MKSASYLARALGLLLLAVAATDAAASLPAAPVTPSPPYPPAELRAKVGGSGVCQVSFNEAGRAGRAVMVASTGSKALDANTVDYALRNWIGRPYSRVLVPITYAPTHPAHRADITVVVTASTPPYPYQARASRTQGSGVFRVDFDEHGKPTEVRVATSTGSRLLDDNTVNFVQTNWYSSGGRKTVLLVPVTYRMVR